MVSIPRDGFAAIPGYGNERVNAAFTFGEIDQRGGGPALAKRTVAELFGVPVDRFALVDIRSMEQIVDTLGGVSIDNPARLVDTQYPTDDSAPMTSPRRSTRSRRIRTGPRAIPARVVQRTSTSAPPIAPRSARPSFNPALRPKAWASGPAQSKRAGHSH